MTQEKCDIKTVEVNRADKRMIEDIITISRKVFPLSIKDNAPIKIRRKWWEFLMNSASVEIYIVSVNKKIVGFYVLIVDLIRFEKEKNNISILEKINYFLGDLAVVIYCPRLSKIAIIKLLKSIKNLLKKLFLSGTSEQEITNINDIVWSETVGVLPEYQRRGLGRHLHNYIIERANELQKKVIASSVDLNNRASIKYFESLCYIATNKTLDETIIYKKSLINL